MESELNVGLLFGAERSSKTKTSTGHQRLQPWGRFNKLDAFLSELVRNGAKDRLSILLLQPKQQTHGAQIGSEVEQVLRRDLAEHHTVPRSPSGQRGDHF